MDIPLRFAPLLLPYKYCPTYPIHSLYCMLLKRKQADRRRRREEYKILLMGYISLYKCMDYIRCSKHIFNLVKKKYYTDNVLNIYSSMYDIIDVISMHYTTLYIDLNSISGIGVKMDEPFECFKNIFGRYVSLFNESLVYKIIEKAIRCHHNKCLDFVLTKIAKHDNEYDWYSTGYFNIKASAVLHPVNKTRLIQVATNCGNTVAIRMLDR